MFRLAKAIKQRCSENDVNNAQSGRGHLFAHQMKSMGASCVTCWRRDPNTGHCDYLSEIFEVGGTVGVSNLFPWDYEIKDNKVFPKENGACISWRDYPRK